MHSSLTNKKEDSFFNNHTLLSISKNIHPIAWLILRLAILNLIILGVAYFIAVAKNLFEPSASFVLRLPFELYIITFFLANLVYVLGNAFEMFYLRIWNKKLNIKEFEGKFFTASIVMIVLVNTAAVVVFVINYYGESVA